MSKKERSPLQKWRDFFNTKFNNNQRVKNTLLYTWYLGDSDLLTQAYLDANVNSFNTTISESRNSKTYFWAVASKEADVKKTHSGIAKAITNTMINVLGYPLYKLQDKDRLDKILDDNDFLNVCLKQQEPMMLSMGDGVYLVSYNKSISKYPIIEYVDARNVAFEFKANRVTKIYTRSYFNKDFDSYCLLQTRYMENGRSCIKFNLFRLCNNKTREISNEVALDTLEETKNLQNLSYDFDEILAVPCIYDFEPLQQRGTSIFNEKMDLLDDLDQCISQGSNSVRLSTPVEHIAEDLLEHDKDGNPIVPNRFDRRYVVTQKGQNDVGNTSGSGIYSSVPQIDFAKYSAEALSIVSLILTGLISPSTLGVNVATAATAESQREKEKQTFFTRDNLIKHQSKILKRLFNLVLKLDDFINDKDVHDYDIELQYPDYSNPTFDARLTSLYPAFAANAISTEKYVDLLYGDTMSEEEKQKEIERLNALKSNKEDVQDPFNL